MGRGDGDECPFTDGESRGCELGVDECGSAYCSQFPAITGANYDDCLRLQPGQKCGAQCAPGYSGDSQEYECADNFVLFAVENSLSCTERPDPCTSQTEAKYICTNGSTCTTN